MFVDISGGERMDDDEEDATVVGASSSFYLQLPRSCYGRLLVDTLHTLQSRCDRLDNRTCPSLSLSLTVFFSLFLLFFINSATLYSPFVINSAPVFCGLLSERADT